MLKDTLPHYKLIKANNITSENIEDEDFRNVFNDFNEKIDAMVAFTEEDQFDDQDKETIRNYKASILALSSEFSKEIEDYLDDETTEELSQDEIEAKIILELHQKDQKSIHLKQLERLGFDTNYLRKYGPQRQVVGNFLLRKEFALATYIDISLNK